MEFPFFDAGHHVARRHASLGVVAVLECVSNEEARRQALAMNSRHQAERYVAERAALRRKAGLLPRGQGAASVRPGVRYFPNEG